MPITIADLKTLIKDWPEKDEFGEDFEVWIETSKGHSNVAERALRLGRGDIIFETNAFNR